MNGTLITGFPGFIAGRLVERLLADADDGPWYFLVEPRFVFAAQRRCEALASRWPKFAERWFIVPGDIRQPDLGLTASVRDRIAAEVRQVWHLAAVYDLAIDSATARAVNIDGTLHVLDLCQRLPRLHRLLYISTCFVAGDRSGVVYEDELDRGQGFRNHYEATKFAAEQQVRRRMADVPTVILRPAVVVGDSRTGEMAKGDGPYFVMRLLLRLPRWVPMIRPGPCAAAVNLVPVDVLVDAMARLAAHPQALGRTFHLADPTPRSAAWLLDGMIEAMGRAPAVATLPQALVSPLFDRPKVRAMTGVPGELIRYFNHDVRFDVRNTAELLADSSLRWPDLADYLPRLVGWAADHTDQLGVAS